MQTRTISGFPSAAVFYGKMENFTASSDKRIVFAGDSNTMGLFAGTGFKGLIGGRANSYPVLVANELGWQDGSFFGDSNVDYVSSSEVSYAQYDPRVSFGSYAVSGNQDVYGKFLICSSASVSDLTFAPGQKFDRVRFWYVSSKTSSQSVAVKINGAIAQTINTRIVSPSFELNHIDLTCDSSSTIIAVQNLVNEISYIVGIETWDSENIKPRMISCACGGAASTKFAAYDLQYPWVGLAFLENIHPDAMVFNCLINDIETATSFDATIANWTAVINKMRAINCDVCNTIPFSWANANVYNGTIDKYANWMARTAMAHGTGFCDYRFATGGDSSIASSLDLIASDGWHPNQKGYVAVASLARWMFKK